MKRVSNHLIFNFSNPIWTDDGYWLQDINPMEDYAVDVLNDLLDMNDVETLDIIAYVHKTGHTNK